MNTGWAKGLSAAQKLACKAIMNRYDNRSNNSLGRNGWSLLKSPSTLKPPKYVELRYRTIEGRIIRRFEVKENGDVLSLNEVD